MPTSYLLAHLLFYSYSLLNTFFLLSAKARLITSLGFTCHDTIHINGLSRTAHALALRGERCESVVLFFFLQRDISNFYIRLPSFSLSLSLFIAPFCRFSFIFSFPVVLDIDGKDGSWDLGVLTFLFVQ